jgi:alkanesulfonate monooxygenase SsuD/methylene tetrahydromethanopterin reductase-like flavin-dependent oxidoreductase (luciferase family)
MRLAYFTMPLHPPTRDYTAVLKEDREAILLAERLGFEEAFVGEHVTDLAEPVTSCLIFLATLISETSTIKLGSGTINLPNTHPAAVAAQVAMIDHLCDGRFILGISPGGLLSDAEVFGNLDADRTAMFLEAIDHVLAIWGGEAPYNLRGKYWSVTTERTLRPEMGQGIIVKPYQRPHPPIVVTAVAPHSKGVSAAAQRGWTPLSANFLQPAWVRSHFPKYQEGCAAAGRTADPMAWRVAKSIFVADDAKTARRYAKGAEGPYAFYFRSLMTKLIGNGRPELFKGDLAMADADVTLDYVLDSLVICGTVEEVVEQLVAFRDRTGEFGTLVYAGHDWAEPALAKRSMELMATEVMPRLNRAIAGRAPALA